MILNKYFILITIGALFISCEEDQYDDEICLDGTNPIKQQYTPSQRIETYQASECVVREVTRAPIGNPVLAYQCHKVQ